ncbi:MAG: hypothetical protein M3O34_13730 [Chloroflexota bacterium]|nr:hypothetical protein [Chloroflexota bacterium]
MAHPVWAIEEMSRAVCAAHLAEAERDRLVALVTGRPRPVRAVVAGLLRAVASWLDDAATPAGECRPARAL